MIILPYKNTPVVFMVRNSWLCCITMEKTIKKISDNTFANEAYTRNPKNAMTFDLDVSMGKIIFKEQN
jgi:hypothetical protein